MPEPANRYAAFISYRHEPVSRKWAMWLHRSIERYVVPKSLRKIRGCPLRVGKVFRDEEELAASSDLSSEIDKALVASSFLIVVCTPRTPHSKWVNEEVLRFRQLGRGDRILALLVEGEPRESFPTALVEIRRIAVESDGAKTASVDTIEPLAADVRDVHGDGSNHVKGQAKLRLIASILGVGFDDLYRRHARAALGRALAAAIVALVLMTLFGALTVFAFGQRELAQGRLLEVTKQKAEVELKRVEAVRANERAETEAAKVRRQLSEQYNDNGIAAEKAGLNAASALWYCKAYQADSSDPQRARIQRLRIDLALGNCSSLVDDQGADDKAFTKEFNERTTVENRSYKTERVKIRYGPENRLLTLPMQVGYVVRAQVSPDGKRAATANVDNTLRIWDTTSAAPVLEPIPIPAMASALAISADSKSVVVGCNNGYAQVFDLSSGKAVGAALNHSEKIRDARFSTSGKLVATACADGTAQIYDAATGDPMGDVLEHQAAVNSIRFNADETLVVTASDDKTARVWDARSGRPITAPMEHATGVSTARISADGACVTTLSSGIRSRHWAIRPHGALAMVIDVEKAAIDQNPVDPVFNIVLSPDGKSFATATACIVQVWDATTGKPRPTRIMHGGSTGSVEFSPDGTRLLTVGGRSARLWDAQTGAPAGSPMVHADIVTVAHFSPDGALIATGSLDKSLRTWDAHTGGPIANYPHDYMVFDLAFSRDGRSVASAANEHSRLIDLRTKEDNRAATLWSEKPNDAMKVSFSPDGAVLILGSRLFDPKTLSRLPWQADVWGAIPTRFDRDGMRAACKAGDGAICVWDRRLKRSLFRLPPGAGEVRAFTLSADGSLLATGGPNGALRLWEIDTGRPVGPELPHGGGINAIVFRENELITASNDGAVRRWTLFTPEASIDNRFAEAILKSSHRIDDRGLLTPLSTEDKDWDTLWAPVKGANLLTDRHRENFRALLMEVARSCRSALGEAGAAKTRVAGAALLRSGDLMAALANSESEDGPQQKVGALRHIAAILRRALPAGDERVGRSEVDLAGALRAAGEWEEATALAQNAMSIADQGAQPHLQVCSRTIAGTLLMQKGQTEEAIKMWTEAAAVAQRAALEDSLEYESLLMNQGVVMFNLNRNAEAETAFEGVLRIIRAHNGSNHLGIAPIYDFLVPCLTKQGKLSEGSAACEEQIRIYRSAASGATAIPVARAQIRLGMISMALNDLAKAETSLKTGYEVLRRNPSADAADAAQFLGACYERTNRLPEAESLFLEELRTRRKVGPAENPEIIESLFRVASVQLLMKKPAEAEPAFREVLSLKLKSVPEKTRDIANAQSGLGRALLSQSKFKEAEPLLRTALATRTEKLGPEDAATKLTATAMIELLEATDRKEEAQTLREKHRLMPPQRPRTQ